MNPKDEHQRESLFLDYPDIITYERLRTILEQMENCICKIKTENEAGTGFFCKIPFPNLKNQLSVLITNNHIINKELLSKPNAKISFSTKNDKNSKEISFHGRKRMTFSKDKYDTTIIEIRNEDNIKNFMELDDAIINDIFKDENNNINEFENQSIYIIQYPNEILSVSFGRINELDCCKSYEIVHRCNTEKGASGSPILKLNNKIIGVHKSGKSKKELYNCGAFLVEPIKEFIEKYNNDKKLNLKNKKNLTPNKNIKSKKEKILCNKKLPRHTPDTKKAKINLVKINHKIDNYNINNKIPFNPINLNKLKKQSSYPNDNSKFIPKKRPLKSNALINSPSLIGPINVKSNAIKYSNYQKIIEDSKTKYQKNINEINKLYDQNQPIEFIKYIVHNYKYKNCVNSEELLKNKSLEKIIEIISPEYNPDYYLDKDSVGVYNEIFKLLALMKEYIKNDNNVNNDKNK